MWERLPLVALLLADKKFKEEVAQEPKNSLVWCQKRGQLAQIRYYIFDKIQHSNPDMAVLYLYESMKKGFYLAGEEFYSGTVNLDFSHENNIINLQELNPSELFTLGLRAYSGLRRRPDKELTFRCFEEITSLDPHDLEVQSNLGVLFSMGKGVEKNIPESIVRYRFAATRGNAEAQYNLGDSYHKGLGVDRDEKEAMKWFRCAAEQGHYLAQNALGRMLAKGSPSEAEFKEGLVWLVRAAEQGSIKARLYLERFDKTMTLEDTIRWQKRTALEGDNAMAWSLALRYKWGEKLHQNYDEAAKWFRVALKEGRKEELLMHLPDASSFEIRYHYCLCQSPVKQEVKELIHENRTYFLQLLKEDDVINQENLFHIIEWICEASSPEEWGPLLTEYLSYLTFAQMVMLFKSQVDLSKCRVNTNELPQDSALDIGVVLFDLLNQYKVIIHDDLMGSYEQGAFKQMVYFTLLLFLNITRESQDAFRCSFACVFAKLLLINFCEVGADCVVNNLEDLERLIEKYDLTEKLNQLSEPAYKKLKP